jgi:hypothetical protein
MPNLTPATAPPRARRTAIGKFGWIGCGANFPKRIASGFCKPWWN